MAEPLSERLTKLIKSTDVEANPLIVAEGARLLAEAQELEHKEMRLTKRVDALEASPESYGEPGTHKSLAEWAYEVLSESDEPMRYRHIAVAIKERGFRHASKPKHPEKQLADSVWTAMYEDDRFVKVGRGIFDLTERL